jgi:hypothetical protein
MCNEPKPKEEDVQQTKEEDVQQTKEERQEDLRRWFESLGDCV